MIRALEARTETLRALILNIDPARAKGSRGTARAILSHYPFHITPFAFRYGPVLVLPETLPSLGLP